jgi:hypothetical protein
VVSGAATTYRGVAVALTAAATDADGDATIAKREWDVDGDGFDDGGGAAKSVSFTTLGKHAVRFRVTDDEGRSEIAEHSITVANRAPAVTLTAPAKAFVGDQVELTGAGSDPDGAATIARLDWDTDGDGFDDGSGAKLRTAFAAAGAKRVRVRVTDDAGATAVAERTIEVAKRATPPTPPGGGEQPPTHQPAPAPPAAEPPASEPPALSLSLSAKRQTLAKAAKGLKLTLAASAAASVTVTVTVDRATARRLGLGRNTKLVALTRSVPAGESNLTLKFSSKVRRALARQRRAVKLKVAVPGAPTLQLTLAR